MGSRDICAGQGFAEDLHHTRFVGDVRVGVHEQNRNGVDVLVLYRRCNRATGVVEQRFLHRTVVEDAFGHFEAQVARHERDVLAKVKVE